MVEGDIVNRRLDHAERSRERPRTFWLIRHRDVSGVSGVGIVAEGTVWSSGAVALHWPTPPRSTSVWLSIADMLDAHGHNGDTTVAWIDDGHQRHPDDTRAGNP